MHELILHIAPRFTIEEMAPDIEKYQQCIASLEATNVSLRNQLIEAGLQPMVGEAATEHPDLSAARSSDDGGCAPHELVTHGTA